MRNTHKAVVAALLCVIVMIMACPTAFAAEPVDLNAECSVKVKYTYEGAPIVGAQFQIYRVADMNPDLDLTLTGVFADMLLEMDDLSNAALQLYARAKTEKLEADVLITTDESGQADAEGLRPGAYLLAGQPVVQGERIHYMDPQMVILPQRLGENEGWSYQLTLRPKCADVPADTKLVDITVVKVWKDQGYEKDRPAAVTVRLLKDDKTVSTVVLSQANQWTYTWSGLLPNADWSVEEDVPEGYVADVEKVDDVFTLTNYRKDIDQTGQIWWPVAVLICVGFAMVIVGILLRRSCRNEA